MNKRLGLLPLALLAFALVACHLSTGVPTSVETPVVVPTRVEVPTAGPTAQAPTALPTAAPVGIPGAVAREHLVALAEGIGRREAGSADEARAAQYIVDALTDAGYAPVLQPFSLDHRASGSANVVAVKPGSSAREIVVGAHYDSTGPGAGADDNASGVAVLLEVAQRIKDIQTPYTVRFVAFGAEEVGLLGSTHYVRQMSNAEMQNTVVMVNLDSLIAGDLAYVYGDEGAEGVLRDWCLRRAEAAGLDLRTQPGEHPEEPAGTTCDCSDHAPFRLAGVPYAYLESTNWTLGERDGWMQVPEQYGEDGQIWHTAYDTIAYLDASFPGRIDQRLGLFATLLYDVLTQFEWPG